MNKIENKHLFLYCRHIDYSLFCAAILIES